MNRSLLRSVLFLAIAAIAFSVSACSKQQPKNETVAEVNGDAIKVTELREFLGMRGGVTPVAGATAERKSQALDRLIAGRLLAQDARAQGLDNTDDFRNAQGKSEQIALITALLRKEIDSKAKVSREEIQAEAKKIMAADNTLSDNTANVQAGRSVSQAKIRKVQEDLIDAAKKEFPTTIHQEMVDKIVGGGTVPDNAVLATAAGDNITYVDVREDLKQSIGGMHGGQSIARSPVAINRMLTREATGKSLGAYAKKQGIEGSDWHKITREDIERTILIDLLAAKIMGDESPVGDEEVDAYYKEHSEMFVQHGKKVPLGMVKEQLRGFLRSEKRKSAMNHYIEELKKKATIKVNEKVLGDV
ncbi:MAG: SurA N-terminal domain-containing protein [Candidatus Deferrimicrobiaceae bacterium]